MFKIFIFVIEIILTLYFCGYGLTSIFLPDKLRKDSFFIIPWLGIILITITGVSVTMARIPLIYGKYIILLISALLILYSMVCKKVLASFNKETKLISIFFLFILFFNLYPLITKAGFPTTISLGNLDPISYTNVSDFLVKNSLLDGKKIVHFAPHLWPVGDLLYYSFRWGSPIFLGFISSLMNVRAYEVYSILITILFALSFPLVYVLSKSFSSIKSNFLILIIFITFGMNSILLYLLYNVFFAQFLFSGIFILILIFIHSYSFKKRENGFLFNSYDFLIGLAVSSVTMIYPEGLTFIIAPISVFFIIKLFTNERLNVFISLLKIGVITTIINPMTLGTAINWNYKIFFLIARTSFIGWEKIRYSTPLDMTGLYNLFYYKNIPLKIDFLIGILVMVILLFGLFKLKNRLIIFSYLTIFVSFYLLYIFVYPNYYTHLKVVSFMLFIFSIIFSIGIISLIRLSKNKIFNFFIVMLLLSLSLRSAIRTMTQLYYHSRVVDKKLISLRELNSNRKINEPFYTSDIFLGEYDIWRRLWQEYFLDEQKIITMTNQAYDFNYFKNIKLVLSEKGITEFEHKKIKYKKIIWSNGYYQLGEIDIYEKNK